MANRQVTIYTRTGCPHCHAAKKFLDSHDVSYEEKNVDEDLGAAEELSDRDLSKTPVIDVGDKTVVGFEKDELVSALDL